MEMCDWRMGLHHMKDVWRFAWGTICADDNWDILDALVTCNQLGHGLIDTS